MSTTIKPGWKCYVSAAYCRAHFLAKIGPPSHKHLEVAQMSSEVKAAHHTTVSGAQEVAELKPLNAASTPQTKDVSGNVSPQVAATPWELLRQVAWTMPRTIPVLFTSLLLLGAVGGSLYLFVYAAIRLSEVAGKQTEVTEQTLKLQELAVKTTTQTFQGVVDNGQSLVTVSTQLRNERDKASELSVRSGKAEAEVLVWRARAQEAESKLSSSTNELDRVRPIVANSLTTIRDLRQEREQLARALVRMPNSNEKDESVLLAERIVRESSQSLASLIDGLSKTPTTEIQNDINSIVMSLNDSEIAMELGKQAAFPTVISVDVAGHKSFLLFRRDAGERFELAYLLRKARRSPYDSVVPDSIRAVKFTTIVRIPDSYVRTNSDDVNLIIVEDPSLSGSFHDFIYLTKWDPKVDSMDLAVANGNIDIVKKGGSCRFRVTSLERVINENPTLDLMFGPVVAATSTEVSNWTGLRFYWNQVAFQADLPDHGLDVGVLAEPVLKKLTQFLQATGTGHFDQAQKLCASDVSIPSLEELCRNLLWSDKKWTIKKIGKVTVEDRSLLNVPLVMGNTSCEIRLDPESGEIIEVRNASR